MKFLLLAAALASVHAEANPAFTYATGYHLPYAIGPVVYTAAAGCQNDAGAVVPCAHGGLVGVVPAASPEAEADPYLLYGAYGHGLYGGYYGYGYHGYGGYHGLGYALGGCRNYLGGLVPCAGR